MRAEACEARLRMLRSVYLLVLTLLAATVAGLRSLLRLLLRMLRWMSVNVSNRFVTINSAE